MKKHAMNIIKFIKNKYRQHKYKQILPSLDFEELVEILAEATKENNNE